MPCYRAGKHAHSRTLTFDGTGQSKPGFPDVVAPLLTQVGFPVREPEKLRVALEHTHRVLWVRSIRGSRWARLGQLLGFARATSDTALSATIWDVVVRCLTLCAPCAGSSPCARMPTTSSDEHPHRLQHRDHASADLFLQLDTTLLDKRAGINVAVLLRDDVGMTTGLSVTLRNTPQLRPGEPVVAEVGSRPRGGGAPDQQPGRGGHQHHHPVRRTEGGGPVREARLPEGPGRHQGAATWL